MSTPIESPDGTIEILNIVPRQGPGGIVAPSCDAAISFAVEEINLGAGILGREIRTTNIDGGRPPREVAAEVSALLAPGMVHAITGWHTSAVRRAVARAGAGRVPHLYATSHEGLADELPGVLMLGEHPSGQTVAAVRWLEREYGVRRWAVIGNDYIWPRRSAEAIRESLSDPAAIVLERYVPLRYADFSDFLAHPALDLADGVVILMVGADVARINRQYAAPTKPSTRWARSRGRSGHWKCRRSSTRSTTAGTSKPLPESGVSEATRRFSTATWPARTASTSKSSTGSAETTPRTRADHTPTSVSSTERNRPSPSSLGPVSGSVACSGCGIKPTTRPLAEAMPAMPRCEPFGLSLA